MNDFFRTLLFPNSYRCGAGVKPSDYQVEVREFDTRTRHLFFFFLFFLPFFSSMGGGVLCMYVSSVCMFLFFFTHHQPVITTCSWGSVGPLPCVPGTFVDYAFLFFLLSASVYHIRTTSYQLVCTWYEPDPKIRICRYLMYQGYIPPPKKEQKAS